MDAAAIKQIALWAETSNLNHLWVSDDTPRYPSGDTLVTLTQLSHLTKKISLGPAVCNPQIRPPALFASTLLALQEIAKGRITAGISAGGPFQLSFFGKVPIKPLKTVAETIEVMRRLFSGEEVSYTGTSFTLRKVKLRKAEKPIPIFVGGRGKKMIELAGRIADGIIPMGVPLEHVSLSKRILNESKNGRLKNLKEARLVCIMDLAISKDDETARNKIRRQLTRRLYYLSDHVINLTDLPIDDVRRLKANVESKGFEKSEHLLTDEMIDQLAIAGSPKRCVERCHQYFKTGVDQLVLYFPNDPNLKTTLNLISSEIVPSIK